MSKMQARNCDDRGYLQKLCSFCVAAQAGSF